MPIPPTANRMTAAELRELTGADRLPTPTAVLGCKVRPGRGKVTGNVKPDFAVSANFYLPFLPPSVNKMYATFGGKRVTSYEYKQKRERAVALIAKECRPLNPSYTYHLQIILFMPCYTKAGKVRQLDASNRVKAVEDWTASALGIDDRLFFKVTVEKRHREGDAVSTHVYVYPFYAVKGAEA